MRIIKQLSVLFLAMLPLCGIHAQDVEQIYMKSGSVVEGYISEQKPGKNITIHSTSATIVANSDSLQNRVSERIPLESLSAEWREWAEENKAYTEDGGRRMLELTTLVFRNSVFSRVFLLERGSILKFLDLTPNEYSFVWGDMYRTVKKKRPHNLFSGIKESLVLNDDTIVEGQIIEQFPGKDIKIETDGGEVLSFKFSQVKKILTGKLNDDMDLWSQLQLLDRIQLKGEHSVLEGFISSRTLSKELVFESMDGSRRTIPLSKIVLYGKVPNSKYVAVYDNVLADGEILLNGSPAYFTALETQDQYLLLGEIVSAQMSVGDAVCLEARLETADTPITVVKAHMESIAQQVGRKKSYMKYPVVTYQDFMQSNMAVSRETTPLGNIRITFSLKEPGDYVIYISGKEGYIVINVIE